MIQLIVRDSNNLMQELDVDQADIILLRKSFADITDIDQRPGSYTKTLGLPKTEGNEAFFGQFGDPSFVGTTWNSKVEAPAWLMEDSNIVIQGSLRVESSDPKSNRINVSISGSEATIKNIIGESSMEDIDMSDWIFEPSQVHSTWNRSIFGGHMVFPIHDFGFGYGLYKKEGSTLVLQNIKNAATPIILGQTIPSFRLNELLRRIFSDHSMNVTGSWFSEDQSEEIYVQADAPLSSFASRPPLLNTIIRDAQTLTLAPIVVAFSGEPISAQWDETLHEYTCPADGDYYWDLTVAPNAGNPGGSIAIVRIQINGIDTGGIYPFEWNTTLTVTNFITALTAGDTVRVTIEMNSFSQEGYLPAYGNNHFNLVQIELSGVDVDPSSYWIKYKQIEFIKGVIQAFNLVLWIENSNTVRLDTWQYYMDNYGTVKDWSDKLETPSIVTRPINGELRNPINISFKESTDVINAEYLRVIGRPYGSYYEESPLPFTMEAAENQKLFIPSPLNSIVSDDVGATFPEVVVAKYFETSDNIALRLPGLALMYYNGLRAQGTDIYTADIQGGATTARSSYPYFSPFRLYFIDNWQVLATTLDLNFTWWTPPTDNVTAPSEQGLYNRYFRDMLQDRYGTQNKILELNFILDPLDIAQLTGADTIIITVEGTPVGLRILEVKDYSPGQRRRTGIKAMLTTIT